MNVIPSSGSLHPAEIPFQEPAARPAFYPASEFEGMAVPSREWLVRDLVPSGTVTLLGGDGGTGKSLLALQLACAVAAGGEWLGYQVAGGGALFISAEDDDAELHRRLAAVVQSSGLMFNDLDRLTICSLAGKDALLARLDRATGGLSPSPLFDELEKRLEDEKPVLLVLDTLADLFPGNENDRAQARQFVGLLRGLAIRHGCAVILLSHPSLSGLNSGSGTSGSTAWNNSVRSRLYLEREIQQDYEPNPDARVLSTKKANYGRTGGEIRLTWRDGVFVADPAETGLDRMAASARAERVFLKLLRTFAEQGRTVNSAGGSNYAPKQFAEHPDSEGVTKRAFKTAMETLLAAGKVKIEAKGPPSKRVTYIAEAGQ
ncbi:AAA family ATPase [Paracoccus haematequi]|nr:AAA family ATPase [Paracoccus haematequi]